MRHAVGGAERLPDDLHRLAHQGERVGGLERAPGEHAEGGLALFGPARLGPVVTPSTEPQMLADDQPHDGQAGRPERDRAGDADPAREYQRGCETATDGEGHRRTRQPRPARPVDSGQGQLELWKLGTQTYSGINGGAAV